MKLRTCIVKSLWAGAVLLFVLFVSSALWWGLAALGDDPGAQGAKGVTLVALICWVVNFVALVVMLALAAINSAQSADGEGSAGQNEGV